MMACGPCGKASGEVEWQGELTAPESDEASMGPIAASGGQAEVRFVVWAGGESCVEFREQNVKASGAILSGSLGGMSVSEKKDRRSVEEPGGGCDDPRAFDKRVVLDLPMKVQQNVP